MKARLLAKEDLGKFIEMLRRTHDEVIAPFAGRGRDTVFDTVTDENQDRIQVHIANPYYPPKRFVLPHIQPIMTFRTGPEFAIEPIREAPRRAIFGIRSCDVMGIQHLDRFYLGRDFRDAYYEDLRQGLFLVNVVCTDPERDIDENCFCVCADTGPAARDHFDMQLMDLGDEFMVLAGSPRGESYLTRTFFRKGGPEHVARRRAILEETRKRFKGARSWYSATVKAISFGEVTEETWESIGNRCLECGGCSYACPTCTCFTVTDRKTGENEAERVRLWDACALNGFTRMAGGHNPRKAVHDRRNRRYFRKLSHYFVQRELSVACVGCGRCIEVCHGDIGMPTVVETIRRAVAAAQGGGGGEGTQP